MLLFSLPYAGGSSSIYYKWRNHLEHDIKLYPLELKGRGNRFKEAFYENLDEAIEDIFNRIKDKIYDSEYALFGHSMGSLLAYELYYKIEKSGYRKPKHIFFSGYRAPNIPRKKKNIYKLSNDDFINEIVEIGGTPEEILNNNELLKLFMPILRNDFKILETYDYKDKENKIECDISVLNGKQDSISFKDLIAWNNYSNGRCKIYNLDGNHFFINDNVENVTSIINSTLTEY